MRLPRHRSGATRDLGWHATTEDLERHVAHAKAHGLTSEQARFEYLLRRRRRALPAFWAALGSATLGLTALAFAIQQRSPLLYAGFAAALGVALLLGRYARKGLK